MAIISRLHRAKPFKEDASPLTGSFQRAHKKNEIIKFDFGQIVNRFSPPSPRHPPKPLFSLVIDFRGLRMEGGKGIYGATRELGFAVDQRLARVEVAWIRLHLNLLLDFRALSARPPVGVVAVASPIAKDRLAGVVFSIRLLLLLLGQRRCSRNGNLARWVGFGSQRSDPEGRKAPPPGRRSNANCAMNKVNLFENIRQRILHQAMDWPVN